MLALSFASKVELLHQGKGYYYAKSGSRQILLNGIRRGFGRDLPLLIYGFSGGAHFSSRFVQWCPERVIAWCAYSAAWWDEPRTQKEAPPGIVACGDLDATRYGQSLTYFLRGRRLNLPWTWVSLPQTAHEASPTLETFAAEFFEGCLDLRERREVDRPFWCNIETKARMSPAEVSTSPLDAAWMPNSQTAADWSRIHQR
jgi:hypothetical protein